MILNAVGLPLRADVERQSLRVVANVGGGHVGTGAVVGQLGLRNQVSGAHIASSMPCCLTGSQVFG